MTSEGLSLTIPPEPVALRAAHHQLKVVALQPRQFLREHCHALAIGTWHPGDVGTPKAARRTERVELAFDRVVNVAPWVRLAGVTRRAGQLDRDVGPLR